MSNETHTCNWHRLIPSLQVKIAEFQGILQGTTSTRINLAFFQGSLQQGNERIIEPRENYRGTDTGTEE
ncbi:hypothetical protein SESBI_12844, partial [Sesbania bispinosa]